MAIAPIMSTMFAIDVVVDITPANELTLTYELRLATAELRLDMTTPVAAEIIPSTRMVLTTQTARSRMAFPRSTINVHLIYS